MPCGPICPASDALCIAGLKGYRPCRRPQNLHFFLNTFFTKQLCFHDLENCWDWGASQETRLLGHRKKHIYYRQAPLESVRKQLEIWPWKTACESLKQQQDSCPKHAKRKPEKLSKRGLRNPLKRKKKMPPARKTLAPGTPLWNRYESNSKSGLGQPHPKASNSSRIRAQSTRNASPKNSRNVAYGTH